MLFVFTLDDFLSSFLRGFVRGLFQFPENLHFVSRVLQPAECLVGLRQEEVDRRIIGRGLLSNLQVS